MRDTESEWGRESGGELMERHHTENGKGDLMVVTWPVSVLEWEYQEEGKRWERGEGRKREREGREKERERERGGNGRRERGKSKSSKNDQRVTNMCWRKKEQAHDFLFREKGEKEREMREERKREKERRKEERMRTGTQTRIEESEWWRQLRNRDPSLRSSFLSLFLSTSFLLLFQSVILAIFAIFLSFFTSFFLLFHPLLTPSRWKQLGRERGRKIQLYD